MCVEAEVSWSEDGCYGDYRDTALDCLADREACKLEKSEVVLSYEDGLCTHTPL
jgi:hypothetical protein